MVFGFAEEPVSEAVPVCRGPGHSRCSYCFNVDDWVGRGLRYRRQCGIVAGVWGPTTFSEECIQDHVEQLDIGRQNVSLKDIASASMEPLSLPSGKVWKTRQSV